MKLTITRAEGCHAYLKKRLGGKRTNGNLLTSWSAIELAVNLQIKEILIATNALWDRSTPLDLDSHLFQGTYKVVSQFALQWVKQHIDTADITKPCTGTFTHAMGLPCAHLCAERKKTYGLLPTDFSTHWYWDRSDTVLPLLEPRTIVWKHGWIVHTAPNTDHELSGFEWVDQEMAVRSPMRCSGCQGLGHNRRSRQCPVVLQSLIASTDHQLQQSEDFQQQIGGIPVNPLSTCATVLSNQVSVSAFQDSPLFRCLQPVSATENTRNSNIPDLSEPLTPARHLNFPIRHLPTPFTHPMPDQWKLDYLSML